MRGCRQRGERLQCVSRVLPVLCHPTGGRTPAPVLSPPPSTAAAPRAQTTQVTRVYKAHWLKETELGEKINPTTRHV